MGRIRRGLVLDQFHGLEYFRPRAIRFVTSDRLKRVLLLTIDLHDDMPIDVVKANEQRFYRRPFVVFLNRKRN